jgi:hypothetical protein
MEELTKADFDGIFQAFQNDDFVNEIRKEAREMLNIAEKSDHFRTVTTMWLKDSLSTVTGAGLEPRKLGAMVLICFLLGMKHQKSLSGNNPDPVLNQDLIDKMLEGLDPDTDATAKK